MKVLDLYAGLGGWSLPFRERGHEIFRIDMDPRFDVEWHADMRNVTAQDILERFGKPDIILASPPCEGFTVMTIGKNWTKPDADPPNAPRNDAARLALSLVAATRRLISDLRPEFAVIENPVDKLRVLEVVADLERREAHYCHLGETNMKPTDLWGAPFPPSLVLPGLCHQRRGDHPLTPDCCCLDHAQAPRGSRTPGSVQGKGDSAERAEIPRQLALLVCEAAERDLYVPTTGGEMSIQAERVDDLIVMRVPSRDVYRIRQVPGARYHARTCDHATGEHWVTPLSWGMCVTLRGVFGADLEIGDSLREWANGERSFRVDPVMALRDKLDLPDDGDLGKRFDELGPLYPFQQIGAAVLSVTKRAILADPMGTGKGPQTIAALRLSGATPALIVCPNSMVYTWEEELQRWWPGIRVSVLKGNATQRRKAIALVADEKADIAVMNWEGLRGHTRLAGFGSVVHLTPAEKAPKELNEIEWAAVVADEAHRAKDPYAKQTRALWAVSEHAPIRLALTGTPVLNSPEDLWSLGHFVSPDEFPTKTAWIDRYCDSGWGLWGGLEIFGLNDGHRDELFAFLDPRFLRRPKEVVLPQLPPKTYPPPRLAEMTAKQRKAYDEMRRDMLAQLDDGAVWVTNALTKLIRLRQFAAAYAEVTCATCGKVERADGHLPDPGGHPFVAGTKIQLSEPSSKIDVLEEIVAEMGGRPIVVFAESRQLLELAGARLKKNETDIGYLTGAVTDMRERQRTITAFQDGKFPVLLATLGAGGEGVTLTAADTVVFLQKSFSRAKNEQAEDRVHRIGQKHSNIEIVTVLTPNTVEDRIEEVLREKAILSEEVCRDRETFRRLLSDEPSINREAWMSDPEGGLTDTEAAMLAGLDDLPYNAWKRSGELRARDIIRDTGRERPSLRSGKLSMICLYNPSPDSARVRAAPRSRTPDHETSTLAGEDATGSYASQQEQLIRVYREAWERARSRR